MNSTLNDRQYYPEARDFQLVHVETDALADHEGINRGDWIVLDGSGVALGVVPRRADKPKRQEKKT